MGIFNVRVKEDIFLLLLISKHWTGPFFPGKSAFVDFTTQLFLAHSSTHTATTYRARYTDHTA